MTGTASPTNRDITVWDFVNMLLRQRRVVVGLPLAAVVVAGVLSLLSPREYTASASFVPQDPASTQSSLGALASQFGFASPQTSTSSPQFYADLLQSREVLREVLRTRYGVGGASAFDGNLFQYFGIETPDSDAAVARGIAKLAKLIAVRTDRTTAIVRFDVHTRSSDLSAAVADRFLELVNDYNLRRRQSQARAEREFVEQRLAAAQADLTTAEETLSTFYRRNRRFTDAPELVAEEARLKRQVDLRQTLFLNLSQSLQAAKIEEVRNTPVITIVEHPRGFVEPRSRGTIANALAALFLAGLAAVAIAFTLESLTRARAASAGSYEEFVSLRRDLLADLRGGLFRRRVAAGDPPRD